MSFESPRPDWSPFLLAERECERIGIFGGTFDPPHVGHMALASAASRHLRLDHIWVMPNAAPPGKDPIADIQRRLQWCQWTFKDIPNVSISTMEASPSQFKHFTVDTLRVLSETRNCELTLLMGHDQWDGMDKWVNTDRIAKYADVAVMRRDEFSSTEIRAMLAKDDFRGAAKHLHPYVLEDLMDRNPYGPKSLDSE